MRKDASSDCCASMVKLLKLTEVGEEILKSGWLWIALRPMHVSVCFRILLCSFPWTWPIVIADKPAWHKPLDIRQRSVDPIYDKSHLSHAYLYITLGFIRNGKRERVFIRKHMSDSTFRLENYSKLYVRVKFLYLFCELFLDYWGNVRNKGETKEKKWLRRKDKVIRRGCWRKKEPAYIC